VVGFSSFVKKCFSVLSNTDLKVCKTASLANQQKLLIKLDSYHGGHPCGSCQQNIDSAFPQVLETEIFTCNCWNYQPLVRCWLV